MSEDEVIYDVLGLTISRNGEVWRFKVLDYPVQYVCNRMDAYDLTLKLLRSLGEDAEYHIYRRVG